MWQRIKRLLFGEAKSMPKKPTGATLPKSTRDAIMNEGDFHSGPHGYSPNTAYPETQYGSNFDEDAQWNEGHVNRPVIDDNAEGEYYNEGDWR